MKKLISVYLLITVALTLSSCSITKDSPSRSFLFNEGTPLSIGSLPIIRETFDSKEGEELIPREILYRDQDAVLKAMNYTKYGETVIKHCINRLGEITYAEIDEEKTTEKSEKTRRLLLAAFWQYRYDNQPDAPDVQCGSYKFRLNKN